MTARIAVTDSGVGISPEDQQRLFVPFTQLENSKTNSAKGTGLGLALTRQLVELMGGKVGVDSKLGEGATFYVEMPVHLELASPQSFPARTSSAPLALIVDDDVRAQELIQLALDSRGYRTLFAGTGEEALTLAREHRPDLITLDVFLPETDGWSVLTALRNDPHTKPIPVIMVTVSTDRSRALSLGAIDHLLKPVDEKLLLGALNRLDFLAQVKQRPIHILVVDDDSQQLELVRVELESQGFHVRTEGTGRAGLAAALEGPVDLLILDLVLPDISGIEVVAALKADPRAKKIPILLLTAHDLTPSERKRLNGDVENVLAKGSLKTENLFSELTQILRIRS